MLREGKLNQLKENFDKYIEELGEMIEYICIEDEEELKDNISDSGSKVVHMKREVNGYFIHVICCQFSDVKRVGKQLGRTGD